MFNANKEARKDMGSLESLVGPTYSRNLGRGTRSPLTNMIVMIVNTIRVLPCLIVSWDSSLDVSAS
jgi:hypothetical protein